MKEFSFQFIFSSKHSNHYSRLPQKKFLCFNFSSCTREALERKSWRRWPKRWAFSECRQGILRMPFLGHAFFLSKVRNDFMKIQNDARLSRSAPFLFHMFRLELKMPPQIWECLFQRFYKCLRLELEMLPAIFENAFRRIENASWRIENAFHALRMLFEKLKMLLTLWECFSKNWKCFSCSENAFQKIENATS